MSEQVSDFFWTKDNDEKTPKNKNLAKLEKLLLMQRKIHPRKNAFKTWSREILKINRVRLNQKWTLSGLQS